MIIKTFVVGDIANNDYLLIDEDSNEAILIDCTDYIPELKSTLDSFGAKLKYILLTHGHYDHLLGVIRTQKEFGCKVYMHKDDKVIVDESDDFMKMVGLPTFEHPTFDKYIDENDTFSLGKTEIKVIHLPGHTPGGVGYLIDNMLFSGDTIFLESIGRTDLPGGDSEAIKKSIREKIFSLDDDTIIYVGHGTETTVGYEKKYNEFV